MKRIYQKCPVCGVVLLDESVKTGYEGWRSCQQENCPLFGIEGFSHHWTFLSRAIDKNHPLVLQGKKDIEALK